MLLIQASRGARQATKTAQRPESQRRHEAHRQGTARAKQTGESQISQTETAGRRSSKTAGTIRKEKGRPGQSQMERAMARKDRGRPGPRRWAHREGEEFALSGRNEKSPVKR